MVPTKYVFNKKYVKIALSIKIAEDDRKIDLSINNEAKFTVQKVLFLKSIRQFIFNRSIYWNISSNLEALIRVLL